tara:strand:+ start:3724 stop:4089 length:366 start_codon:yes stop_codon:yes gene_type:complete
MEWFTKLFKKKKPLVVGVKFVDEENVTRIGFSQYPPLARVEMEVKTAHVTRLRKRRWSKDKKFVEVRYDMTAWFYLWNGEIFKLTRLSFPVSKEEAMEECIQTAIDRIRLKKALKEKKVSK